jgi:signal transduction histidine kinase/ActR/RegA family two-component response regulator
MLDAVRRSLRAKIVIVVLLTTFAALAVSAVALLVYETRNYGAFLLRDAATQAQLLADITVPALAFDDPAAARTNLEILSQRGDIDAAAVYSADGTLFATYARSPDMEFPALGPAGSTIEGRTLTVFQPIVQNEEVMGSLYLRSSYDVGSRLVDYLMILLGVMVSSFLVATLMSLWLAGGVTNPLRALTDVVRHIIERRDFARRAPRTTDDEIGVFVDAFNTMVAEVGQRAEALEASNRALQQETEERRQAEIALRRADQRKDEFLATLAHELRNPLAPMVNSMALLEQPGIGAAAAERAHGIIRRQLGQMVRLVDDLLDVSRITSGKLGVRKERIELAQVVQNAVDTARPLLEKLGQSFSIKLPRDAVYLQGDAVRLSQVFANLLNNAARYSEPGQKVSLRATVDGDCVRVVVADQGMGIEPGNLETIFDMFTQGEGNDRAQGGLGVGLTLARRLVELHGGKIVAESRGKGQGSAFTVTLPATTMPPAQEATVPAKTPNSKPHRILLVDDNVDFATSMSTLLQGLGHEVRIAHDAAAALAVAREQRPELGFLDLGLPDKSGYELATELRAQPETASTVLVAVSGWGQPRDRERSRDAGFAMHLVKPVELQSINAAIAALVQDDA